MTELTPGERTPYRCPRCQHRMHMLGSTHHGHYLGCVYCGHELPLPKPAATQPSLFPE